jgi:hypothetical protein
MEGAMKGWRQGEVCENPSPTGDISFPSPDEEANDKVEDCRRREK